LRPLYNHQVVGEALPPGPVVHLDKTCRAIIRAQR
jgi:hypothetical protein